MDYSKLIGEEVTFLDSRGTIVKMDEDRPSIDFHDGLQPHGFLFNPFLTGRVRLVNKELQAEFDKEIDKYVEVAKERLRKLKTNLDANAKYVLYRESPDLKKVTSLFLDCSEEEARQAFGDYVYIQTIDVARSAGEKKWEKVVLMDASTNEVLCQAS